MSGDGRLAGFALLAVLLHAGTLSAQTVQGMVFDEGGGQPLTGAVVQVLTPSLDSVSSASADRIGHYEIVLDTAGTYVIIATHEGYATSSPEVVDVGIGETLNLMLALNSLTASAIEVQQSERDGRSAYLSGRVVQQGNRQPVEDVEIILLESATRAVTNANGRFVFREVTPGFTTLEARHLGFGTQRTELVVEPGVAYQFDVTMAVEAIEIEGITVTTRSRFRARRLEPVFARMDLGVWGEFRTVEDFERRGNPPVAAMLQGMLSTNVRNRGVFWSVSFRGCGRPSIYVDGVLVSRVGVSEFLNMSTIDVEVIEVYRRLAGLPIEFMSQGTRCAIGIWTKRGG